MNYEISGSVKAKILGEIKSGQFPHTCLLTGRDEESRKNAAMVIASALVCESGEDLQKPCEGCSACKKVFSMRHPDVSVIGAGEDAVKVDDIRRARADAYVSPFEADNKVIVFEQAQKLNVQSQNALLKILEEPPENVYFILTAPSADMLLSTVVSRCVIFSLGSLTEKEICDSLADNFESFDEKKKNRIGRAVMFLDGFEMREKSLENLCFSLDISDEFYASGAFPFEKMPTKKEESEKINLIFKVLSLCALEIAESKKGARKNAGILDEETLRIAASKISVKTAFSQHELFFSLSERIDASANIGAVMATLRTHLTAK